MSDSPPSESGHRFGGDEPADEVEADAVEVDAVEVGAVEADAVEADEPARTIWGDIEDGIAQMFTAFERGIINIADSEGRRRGADDHDQHAAEDSSRPLVTDMAVTVDKDRADEHRSAPVEVAAPRPGMTYDEALAPVRWGRVAIGVVAVLILAALYWAMSLAQVVVAADDVDTATADAIVVLGAAQFDGTPSPALAARLDHALDLWRDGRGDVILTTGSNQEGDRFTEGFSGFVYLREAGVPEDAILTIVDGDDTYQQMTAAQTQLDGRSLSTALLVSDGFHTFRLRSIADEIGLDATVVPTRVEATSSDYVREATAVSIGRLVSYRRLSAWISPASTDESAGPNP